MTDSDRGCCTRKISPSATETKCPFSCNIPALIHFQSSKCSISIPLLNVFENKYIGREAAPPNQKISHVYEDLKSVNQWSSLRVQRFTIISQVDLFSRFKDCNLASQLSQISRPSSLTAPYRNQAPCSLSPTFLARTQTP